MKGNQSSSPCPCCSGRLTAAWSAHDVAIAKAVRVHRTKVVRPNELEKAIALAQRTRDNCAAILVLLDAEDDDAQELRETLQDRANRAATLPVAVVVAVREFEAWFLAAKESLRGKRGIRADAAPPENPEGIRGAKERLSANMKGRSYLDVDDQPALASEFDMKAATERCASFAALLEAVRGLVSRLSGTPRRTPET